MAISNTALDLWKYSLIYTVYDVDCLEKIDFGKELDTEHKAWKTIWSAGQGSALIEDKPVVSELMETLKSEFKHSIEEQYKMLKVFPK